MFNRKVEIDFKRSLDSSDDKFARYSCIACTDAVVDMGGYKEKLVIGGADIDTSACKSVLFNHDADFVIGGVDRIYREDNSLRCDIALSKFAKAESDVYIWDLVEAGYITGVSIGYLYKDEDVDFIDGVRRVRKWELREVTLTPIQADKSSFIDKVRNLKRGLSSVGYNKGMDSNNKLEEGRMTDVVKSNVELEKVVKERDIAVLCSNFGLKVKQEYLESSNVTEAVTRMMKDKAESEKTEPVSKVMVTRSGEDKAAEKCVEALLHVADEKLEFKGNELIGTRSLNKLVKSYAQALGQTYDVDNTRNAQNLSKRGVNQVSDMFSTYVLKNALDKSMLRGYENYGKYSTYNLWTYKHLVRDFKDVYNVAIDVGSLTATVEGAPLPELATADIGASGKVGVYGGTVSLSFQSMINDDMGAFMRIVGNAGYNANRSIDELLYTTLEAATITGTNNLVASVPLGTAGNLDTVRAGFMAKTGPSGKKLGNVPRKLIVPPNIAKSAAEATWNVVAPGSTALFSAPENRDIDTVISPYLTSTSTYYLAGDPSVNPAFDLLFLQGFETPIIQEYDVGSVLGRAWKIALPFGVLFNSTTVAGSIYIPGLVKATA